MFHKLIYILGSKLRNPSLKNQFDFLKESETWPLEKLEAYQLEKLQELVLFSYSNSTYYKNIFDEINIKPSDIKELKDLKKLPILTKKDVLINSKKIQSNYSFKKKFTAVTSGSTGNALNFYRDEHADSFNRAAINRGYSWHDINPWDRNGYFWGFNFSFSQKTKTLILDSLQNRFRLFSYRDNELKSFIKKLKNAKYIHGYSSMIYQTARLINEQKLTKPKKLKMIKGTSEKIFEKYQEEVKKAFGLKIISEYGATESGIIAFECLKGKMHINMEGAIIEEINNEILVTNLQMKSFPIIRYKLGDYIELASNEEKCSCGKNHYILKEVTGRIGNNIYGNKQIYPSLYLYYIFKNLDKKNGIKLNYQVVQKEKGKLLFKVDRTITLFEKELLIKEVQNHFKDDIIFSVKENETIKSEGSKLKSFISMVD